MVEKRGFDSSSLLNFIMKEDQLIKKNKDLDLENKKLKRQLLFEQQLRKKVERKLRINKRETERLTMENQQLKRKPI